MSKKVIEKQVDLNADELKQYLRHIIKNNRFLQESGRTPVAISISGESGLGKTSIVDQIATEEDMHYVKINLAQIGEEVSELVGYPIRQFEMCKETDCIWVDEQVVENYKGKGYDFTGKNRTGYCPPEWIAGLADKPGIFLLDDHTRGAMRTLQAVMEIVSRQEYISWKLPKGWTVILTENPADGDYLVNEIDVAQRSRYTSVNLKFDGDCWGRYAEEVGIDGRCINFLLLHEELVTKGCNPRSIVNFFNSISSIKNFESELPLIQMLGEGSVGLEFSSMFTSFINNKLDKLINPKEMVQGKNWEEVKKKMIECIGEDNNYRADIASVLGTRVVNYSQLIAKEGTVSKDVIERLVKITTEGILQDDVSYYMVKKLVNGDGKEKFSQMLNDKKVVVMATK